MRMELWDAYDQNGNRTGDTLVRGQPIPQGLYHLVCGIVVRHVNGDFLLMLRSAEKEVYPNAWEIGAGGSALQGESSLACARRELGEETGIVCEDLVFQDRQVRGNAIYDGYLCITDWPKDQIRLQVGETVDYRWLSQAEFVRYFDSDTCIPPLRERLWAFVDTLR